MKDERFFRNREAWQYRRGDLYFATLNPFRGSEQGGKRPVLVVQNDVGNAYSTTLIIAPLTSRVYKKDDLPTHYLVKWAPGLPHPSLVLLEQLRTIDKVRIIAPMGRLLKSDMDNIDNMLRSSLGLYLTRVYREREEGTSVKDVKPEI